MTLGPGGLYAIADVATLAGAPETSVEAAIAGGASLVQLRDKRADRRARRKTATRLARICARGGVGLLINDDVELAAEIGAAGAHLGRDDMSLVEARARLGPGAIIGASCYDSLERARAAVGEGASYIAFGCFFPSPTKPWAVRARAPLLAKARRNFNVPLVAIGGITPANGAALVDAGADFLAVASGLFTADGIRARAREYVQLFNVNG